MVLDIWVTESIFAKADSSVCMYATYWKVRKFSGDSIWGMGFLAEHNTQIVDIFRLTLFHRAIKIDSYPIS